jgi:hypothetical protein
LLPFFSSRPEPVVCNQICRSYWDFTLGALVWSTQSALSYHIQTVNWPCLLQRQTATPSTT